MSEFYEECYEGEHVWGEPEDLGNNIWQVTCKRCGEQLQEILILEYWKRKTITVLGKTYPALKAWGNISKCSECGKVIFDVPLILWSSNDTSKALTFCWKCAEQLGILEQLVHSVHKGDSRF